MAGRYSSFLKQIFKKEADEKLEEIRKNPLFNAREILRYDQHTGVFTWLVSRGGTARIGTIAGHTSKSGYVEIFVNSKKFGANRLAWWFVHGEMPEGPVDHINRNTSDNRICNLRAVSYQTNSENKSLVSGVSKSGWTGVEKIGDGYRSFIESKGKRFAFGSFKTIEEAKASYFTAKTILHEGMITGAE